MCFGVYLAKVLHRLEKQENGTCIAEDDDADVDATTKSANNGECSINFMEHFHHSGGNPCLGQLCWDANAASINAQ